ncbi:GNAT family N-acetyltransferase [Endothiovibrio diazotrophicus]
MSLQVQIEPHIDAIPAEAWNALAGVDNPFLRHEFLAAMERHGCVGETFGWRPCHLAVWDGERLIGAMPLYEKENSYGEFVFDHAWAEAYRRLGMDYFPKLVSAIPYTPATGRRLLAAPGREGAVWPLLLAAARELAGANAASGVHCLFAEGTEQAVMEAQGWLVRHDCQYHWENRGYRGFDQFLDALSAKKRKNIRRERRRVAEAGVRLRRLDGFSAGEADWRHFARFYDRTFETKWGIATFNLGFFREVAERMPEAVVLVLADDAQGECVAGALMYRGSDTLYGRHWGCIEEVDCLHFEACYYQGIDYCIEQGMKRFEPGAQGEHKIPRGFLPTLTRSAHWLADERLRPAIADFCERERAAVADQMTRLASSSPYRSVDPSPKEPNQ